MRLEYPQQVVGEGACSVVAIQKKKKNFSESTKQRVFQQTIIQQCLSKL